MELCIEQKPKILLIQAPRLKKQLCSIPNWIKSQFKIIIINNNADLNENLYG